MPRYFFNLHNGIGPILDEEGQLLPDIEAARDTALTGIRSILADELARGDLDLKGRIDIVDDRQDILLSVSFEEAVAIKRATGKQ